MEAVLFLLILAGVFYYLFGRKSLNKASQPMAQSPAAKMPSRVESRPAPKVSTASSQLPTEIEKRGIATAHIRYEDAQGALTERRVTILEISNWMDDVALQCFCHARQGYRTFLVTRIKQMTDIATGEVVEDPVKWIEDQYFETHEGRHAKALSECSNEVSIMVYVARADGRMMGPERAIIVDYLVNRCSELSLDPDFLDEASRSINVENLDFDAAVRQLSVKPMVSRRLVVEASEAIIATQKSISPGEQRAIEKLKAMLTV